MESSKSAMNTLAPELRALMTILRSDGPGDLHAAILKVGGGGAHPPVPGADRCGAGQEVKGLAGIQALLPGYPRGQEFPTARAEATFQVHHEFQSLGGEDLLKGGG